MSELLDALFRDERVIGAIARESKAADLKGLNHQLACMGQRCLVKREDQSLALFFAQPSSSNAFARVAGISIDSLATACGFNRFQRAMEIIEDGGGSVTLSLGETVCTIYTVMNRG